FFSLRLSFDTMKLLSLNVGRPQEIEWNGKLVRTSIFKSPVEGKRKISFLNIEGDEQSDLRVHGGINKAVYAYDLSNYQHWKTVLQRDDWHHGLFGENLTTEGLPDAEVKIGDVYRIGTAVLQAVQPRFPCFKLNVRFALPDMMEQFMEQKRNGIYFKVVEEGFAAAGDAIRLLEASPYPVTMQQYVECYYSKGAEKLVLETILSIPFLPEGQRKAFESFRQGQK
ncbi:MAG TPA: MOSC domain-containing protein, partial [Flavisolibacter sp.]|nr:MOSC domain-containing protein [Flavisolibacter sp.]